MAQVWTTKQQNFLSRLSTAVVNLLAANDALVAHIHRIHGGPVRQRSDQRFHRRRRADRAPGLDRRGHLRRRDRSRRCNLRGFDEPGRPGDDAALNPCVSHRGFPWPTKHYPR